MGRIIAILSLGLLMTVMTIVALRRAVRASTVELPELAVADRAIVLFALGLFTLAIVNGAILVAAKGLP
jgi:type II secretory pathway component PulJ